ncbi:winged helix-turn-helix domain-containing protein [Planctomicrobium sp. SH668]|uniref:winged helix-turn-helix domain-containing protein n=1 Tax=Planctomicrobium sp. SH668 TaxID=3448126 RepID=UPI003F5C435B
MPYSILDACEIVLLEKCEPLTCDSLAYFVTEMELWRASGADVQVALDNDIHHRGADSRFVSLGDNQFGLREWKEAPLFRQK